CETSRRVATSSTVSPSGSHTNACARCSALGSWVVWATSTSLWYSVDERRRSIDFSPFHSGDSMLHHIYDRTFCNLLKRECERLFNAAIHALRAHGEQTFVWEDQV